MWNVVGLVWEPVVDHLVRRIVDAVDQVCRLIDGTIELRPGQLIPQVLVSYGTDLVDLFFHGVEPREESWICEE